MLYAYDLLFFGFLTLQDFTFCLRLIEIRIPNYVIKGSSAQLECLYDLDGESLYSVKWYKDGNEFYRYVPRDMPPAQTFLLPGVSVDIHNSSDAVVTLREVTLQSTGRFRCEVSGEAPSFQTVTEHGDMIVVSLPDQGPPKISGGRPRYQIGDWVRINCTAGRSKPAVQLSWFINGEAAEPHFLKKYDVIISGREALETSVLGLQFRVEQHHFHNGDMKLKCVASLSTFYWRSNEESVEGDRPQKAPVLESRETVYASNSRADPVQGMSLRESFLTKILSFFIQPNAASSKTDSMLLNRNSTNLQIIIIALITLAIIYGSIEHIYLTAIILKRGSAQQIYSVYNHNNNNNTNNNFKKNNHIICRNDEITKENSSIKIQVEQRHLMTRHGELFPQQQEEQIKEKHHSLYEIRDKNERKLNKLHFNEEMSTSLSTGHRHWFKTFQLFILLFLFPLLIIKLLNIQEQKQQRLYKQQQMAPTVNTVSTSVIKKLTINSRHLWNCISNQSDNSTICQYQIFMNNININSSSNFNNKNSKIYHLQQQQLHQHQRYCLTNYSNSFWVSTFALVFVHTYH